MNKKDILKKNTLDLEHSEYLIKAGGFFTAGLTISVTIFLSLRNEDRINAFILMFLILGIGLLKSSEYFNNCKTLRKKIASI